MPAVAVGAARDAGFDVTWMSEAAPGSDDEAVLAKAVAERRVLVTFDKDFGEMDSGAGVVARAGLFCYVHGYGLLNTRIVHRVGPGPARQPGR